MFKYAPWLGLLVAIAATTTLDATGLSLFSALPLLPLAGGFWFLQRFSRRDIGLTWGTRPGHGLAVLYPLAVLGAIAGIGFLMGDIDLSEAKWGPVGINILAGSTVGILMGLLTEEGFFRGWLWASLRRAGLGPTRILWVTTIGFTLWHVSAITLAEEFRVPMHQMPVYLVNATFLGLIWGMLRLHTGSILVPAVSHALWNALDYPLFGFGEKTGALGLSNTMTYGPEVGFLGILFNTFFALFLWYWFRSVSKG